MSCDFPVTCPSLSHCRLIIILLSISYLILLKSVHTFSSYNIVGLLPASKEYAGIMVVVDRFSKMAWYIPITMNITFKGIAKTLWEQVFKDTDISQKVISNWGPQVISNFMKELWNQLEIEQNPLSAYYPQTNGQQREPTRKWNNTSSCMSATDKTTGPSGYWWPSLFTTTDIQVLWNLRCSWISEDTKTSIDKGKHQWKRYQRWMNLFKE